MKVACTWKHADCFAAEKTRNSLYCNCLINTEFQKKEDCSFYKSKKKLEKELDELEISVRTYYPR